MPVRAAIANTASVVTRGADRQRQRRPRQPVLAMLVRSDSAGSVRSTSTKIDQRQRLHQELGQRQVGRAVEREDGAAAVAGDADQQHRRQPVAHHRRAHRGGQDQQPDDHLQRRVPQRELGPVARAQRQHDHRHHRERGQDHRLGGRDRAALGGAGQPHGQHVGAAERPRRRCGRRCPAAGRPVSARRSRARPKNAAVPIAEHQHRQQQRQPDAVPQRQVVVLPAGNRVGVGVEHMVQRGGPQPEHQAGRGQDGRRRQETWPAGGACPRRACWVPAFPCARTRPTGTAGCRWW